MAPPGKHHRGQGARPVTQGDPTNSPHDNVRPGNAGYDGPSDNRGRSPSTTGQSQTGRPGSRNRSGSRGPATGGPAPRTDPARDPPPRTPRVLSRNVDFGGDAYNVLSGTGYVSIVLISSLSDVQTVLVHCTRSCAFIHHDILSILAIVRISFRKIRFNNSQSFCIPFNHCSKQLVIQRTSVL